MESPQKSSDIGNMPNPCSAQAASNLWLRWAPGPLVTAAANSDGHGHPVYIYTLYLGQPIDSWVLLQNFFDTAQWVCIFASFCYLLWKKHMAEAGNKQSWPSIMFFICIKKNYFIYIKIWPATLYHLFTILRLEKRKNFGKAF